MRSSATRGRAADRLASAGIREHRLVVIGNGLAPELFAAAEPVLARRPDYCASA